MKNKKGAELTIGTIIIIILAIVVLVFLVYGFTTGWGNLWDKISNWGGSSSNVQTIIQGCQVACTTNAGYDYVDFKRQVVLGDGTKFEASCKELESGICFDSNKNQIIDVTEQSTCESDGGGKWQKPLISTPCQNFAS